MKSQFFEVFYKEQLGPLRFYLARRWRISSEEADDIAQDAFMRIYSKFESQGDQFESLEPAGRRSYLFRTASNLANDRYRRTKIVPMDAMEDDFDLEGEDQQVTMERDQLRKRVTEAINEDKDSAGLRLHYIEGWTLEEISEHLKQPLGTVATRIQRFKKKMMERFGSEKEA